VRNELEMVFYDVAVAQSNYILSIYLEELRKDTKDCKALVHQHNKSKCLQNG
jgi:hypothetical protein